MDVSQSERFELSFPNITSSGMNITPTKTTIKYKWWSESGKIQIPFYGVIFMLSVIGNMLVILTLAQNRRMRTVTNLFLLNLAVSDLLLGVFCMPFTLVGALLRDFVFGESMCKLIPFLQACTVSVGAWTLVAISVERYYAICHPLRSLAWQTLSHAYKTILAIWVGSFICMMPIAILSQLKPTRQGKHKCREDWPTVEFEKAYNLFLDVILMIMPFLVLVVTYSLISRTLYRGIKREKHNKRNPHYVSANSSVHMYVHLQRNISNRWSFKNRTTSIRHPINSKTVSNVPEQSGMTSLTCSKKLTTELRRTNIERILCNKRRIIKMLFVVVLEFFLCWTPLYIINTIALFDQDMIYNSIGYTGISFFQLLAYSSSCCNPITYCFMNCSFRKSFFNIFKCFKVLSKSRRFRANESDINLEVKWTNRCSENHTS
ncbi:cholecystokinin receptor-like isoform X1 [Cylas formicarius]|uniref:cholecystokinin receptor-like isoform X1 n=1 Tax=Cylas formicarius TaxID=197179 RepID=UPI0029584653|nr:cholecystokinin receptor-like isoform X1 [Cylas formicarius]